MARPEKPHMRELRRALHEQHDAVALDEVVDALLNVAHGASRPCSI